MPQPFFPPGRDPFIIDHTSLPKASPMTALTFRAARRTCPQVAKAIVMFAVFPYLSITVRIGNESARLSSPGGGNQRDGEGSPPHREGLGTDVT